MKRGNCFGGAAAVLDVAAAGLAAVAADPEASAGPLAAACARTSALHSVAAQVARPLAAFARSFALLVVSAHSSKTLVASALLSAPPTAVAQAAVPLAAVALCLFVSVALVYSAPVSSGAANCVLLRALVAVQHPPGYFERHFRPAEKTHLKSVLDASLRQPALVELHLAGQECAPVEK